MRSMARDRIEVAIVYHLEFRLSWTATFHVLRVRLLTLYLRITDWGTPVP